MNLLINIPKEKKFPCQTKLCSKQHAYTTDQRLNLHYIALAKQKRIILNNNKYKTHELFNLLENHNLVPSNNNYDTSSYVDLDSDFNYDPKYVDAILNSPSPIVDKPSPIVDKEIKEIEDLFNYLEEHDNYLDEHDSGKRSNKIKKKNLNKIKIKNLNKIKIKKRSNKIKMKKKIFK